MPGSGGWITAENMSEYFDEVGNWRGSKEGEDEHLGPGAGTVRSREEDPGPEEDREGDNTNYRGSVRRA
jgi:nucleotide-sensitive chloride channel 1A